jgi:predicted TIM-barrel fold metal-dependent hydrolase
MTTQASTASAFSTPVPNSAGVNAPVLPMPLKACDCHLHIYDARFAQSVDAASLQDLATVNEYRLLQKRLGTERAVIVTPRSYGVDNDVTLDAIAQLGLDRARGVAVLRSDVSDTTLKALDAGGIRGVRFSLYTPKHAAASFEMVEPLAARIANLGWHLQLHWTADQIVEHEAMLKRLPTPIVLDHMTRLPQPLGLNHPAVKIVDHLLAQGRTWIKLSGAYLDSQVGEAGDFLDIDAVARHWITTAPNRLVWGSDWPHPTEMIKPNDANMLDMLARWTTERSVIEQILVTNPSELYGFD